MLCLSHSACALGTSLVCTLANLALVSVAFSAISYDSADLKNTAWAYSTNSTTDDDTHSSIVAYYGLREVYFPDAAVSTHYASCRHDSEGFCHDCYVAGIICLHACAIAIVVTFIMLLLNIARLVLDHAWWKMTHLFATTANFVLLGLMIGIWYRDCMSHIKAASMGTGIGTAIGPGYAAVIASVAFNAIVFWLCLLTPVLYIVTATTGAGVTKANQVGEAYALV